MSFRTDYTSLNQSFNNQISKLQCRYVITVCHSHSSFTVTLHLYI